ncbi:uncharacterized protein TNIN_310651 [Trichonephila inaurata madagascariensis]|uniref:Uncharacterized protein n=1 Tax=Trichonephila inaurata madagascariensis TaxID=2747483 RepID=A0A8X6WMK8_9ARAC|nr:uncharacterized protein TNIN_310651 [Trichonephila inaurata madagascariensis]
MTFPIAFTCLAILLLCLSMIEQFFTGNCFYTVSIVLNVMLRDLYKKTVAADLKKRKQSGIICTCNLQQFELICYESIDILQAPRLVNNPFAYAYTNNPFCGK